MVGLVGLEPTTLCSQSRCASQLRYSPKWTNPNAEKEKPPDRGEEPGLTAERH